MSSATRTTTLPSNILQSSYRETIRNAVFEEPCTPPEYKCCFGEQWPPRVKDWTIWDLKPDGAANQLWNNTLFSYTKDLVNNIKTAIEVDAAIHAWMVGKNEIRARPTVVIFSTSKKFRGEARRVILRNGILAKYNFGVMTLSATISRDSKRSVYLTKPERRSSAALGVQLGIATEDGRSWQVSTSGGAIHIGSQRYGLTVAHVFEADQESQENSAGDGELAFDEYSDDDDHGSTIISEDGSVRVSHEMRSVTFYAPDMLRDITGKRAPTAITDVSHSQSRTEAMSERPIALEDVIIQFPIMGYLEDPPKLHKLHDWALFALETGIPRYFSGQVISPLDADKIPPDQLRVATGRGTMVEGRGLPSLCAVKLKGTKVFTPVWAAQLSDATIPGDCGSWVLGSFCLVGMLTSSCPSLALAYFLPAHQIVADIQGMFSMPFIIDFSYYTLDLSLKGKAPIDEGYGTKSTVGGEFEADDDAQRIDEPSAQSTGSIPSAPTQSTTLWMGNLDQWINENIIRLIWHEMGESVKVKMIGDSYFTNAGYCLVDFQSPAAAAKALSLDGNVIPGTPRQFRLKWAFDWRADRGDEYGPGYSIFVGNLGPEIDENALASLFQARFPSCKTAKIIVDRITGISCGYGFVCFGNEADQQRAITDMDGIYCGNRPMRVTTTMRKNKSNDSGVTALSMKGGIGESMVSVGVPLPLNLFTDPDSTTILIEGLSNNMTEDELRSYFSSFGEITYAKMPPGKGCGFVQYTSRQAAEIVMGQMQACMIGNSLVHLSWAHSQDISGLLGTPYVPASSPENPSGGKRTPSPDNYPDQGWI